MASLGRDVENQWVRLRSKLKYVSQRRQHMAASQSERDFLERLFVPHYYARMAGLSSKMTNAALFRHFLSKGLAKGISPSPLFEPSVFREREGVPDPALRDVPAVLRWYRTRSATGIVPTTRFDAVFYLQTYEEVAKAGVDPFEHFVRFGLAEKRRPNGIFDPEFYERIAQRGPGEGELPSYLHYLVFGAARGSAPASFLVPVLARTAADRAGGLIAYDRATTAITPWVHDLGANRTAVLLGLFHPYLYDGDGALNGNATDLDRLIHYLQEGIDKGIDPGPMFDSSYYAASNNLELETGGPAKALLHFLHEGANGKLVPTKLFNDEAYYAAWSDMRDPAIWRFGHFISNGIYEGRRIDGSERVNAWTLPLETTHGLAHNWQLFWDELGYPAPVSEPSIQAEHRPPDDALEICADLTDNNIAFVRALFQPIWYARQAGLDPATPKEELLAHYLAKGIETNISPSPLFDPEVAIEIVGAEPTASAMKVWLARRQPNWPAPSQLIELDFYRRFYADLRNSDQDLYEHFIVHGLRELRSPSPLFDPVWYDQAYERPANEAQLPAYEHYLMFGADRGLAPSRLLLPCFAHAKASGGTTLSDYRRLASAARLKSREVTLDQLQTIFAFFMPYAYDGGGILDTSTGGVERLIDFLERGMALGLSPGPFFDAEYYTEEGIGWKLLSSRRDGPFLHYLKHGWPKKFVPNQIFNEELYRNSQADIKAQNVWGFRHFLNHGIFEGRKIDIIPSLTIWPRATDFAGSQLSNWMVFWSGHSSTIPAFGLLNPLVTKQQQRLVEFVTSKLFDEIVCRAQRLDPAVGEPRKITSIYAAPHHDQLFDALERLHERISGRQYASIVTVPWLRTGGADLVACQLAGALKEAFPEDNVLLLRVDQSNFERPDWIPGDVDHVNISDILKSAPDDHAETLLYSLFLHISPLRIANVNSLRVWRTFERYGGRLSEKVALYSYLFCWDQTPEGLRVGYPSMFYASVSPHLTGTLTDTTYLREELIKLYRPPADVAARTQALYTPARTEPTNRTFAEISVERRVGKRPLILWAGRLDRQKRFDLVQEIARRMPHVDFHCWGDALLDSPPDFGKSPKNLVLSPGFKDYSELPFENADMWLFTSAWEGMPTILIEIAVRGMSVVASQVGGVPELVNDDTGFAVHDIDNVDAYVNAVQFAIDNPSLRLERAKKLQALATERYTRPSYVRQLKDILNRESQ